MTSILCPQRGQPKATLSEEKAMQWLQTAANNNVSSALFALGVCHMTGLGVDQSNYTGVALLAKASKFGHARAQYCLGSESVSVLFCVLLVMCAN